MRGDLLTTLIDENKIQTRVAEIAKELGKKFANADKPPIFICVLKGASFFYADLIKAFPHDCKCDFMGCSSYGSGTTSSGEVKVTYDLSMAIKGEDVVLVEDIVDSGHTLNFLNKFLKTREPKSITTVSLLHKPEAKQVDYELDMKGFEIGNEFVVGYGLDFNNFYRHLPEISVLTNTQLN